MKGYAVVVTTWKQDPYAKEGGVSLPFPSVETVYVGHDAKVQAEREASKYDMAHVHPCEVIYP